FHPDALTEVSLSAALPELDGARIHGTVDRLIIGEESILVVDFKSNRIVPDTAANCPDGLLRQMGAYTAALSRIYPQHRIDTAILWTRTATFMPLPHDLVVAALRGGRYLDAPLPRP